MTTTIKLWSRLEIQMHCWPTWPCFSLLDLTTLTLPPCNDPLMVEQTKELLNSQKGFLVLCLKSLHFGNFCYFFTLGALLASWWTPLIPSQPAVWTPREQKIKRDQQKTRNDFIHSKICLVCYFFTILTIFFIFVAQSLFLPLVDPSYPHPASSMNPLREQGIWGDQKNTSYGFVYHEIGLLCPFFSIPVIFSILASFGTHSAPCKLLCPHPSPLYEPPDRIMH